MPSSASMIATWSAWFCKVFVSERRSTERRLHTIRWGVASEASKLPASGRPGWLTRLLTIAHAIQ